ncbi:MAG: Uma2 family endonuclease, partial [Actinomycetia bacterium]|nr:Uma2 family endonuclease [Actinomycetes bacterium]
PPPHPAPPPARDPPPYDRGAPPKRRLQRASITPQGPGDAESAHRDRTVKLRKYAEAGIPHYWCIEEEDGAPVVHVYELDVPTEAYAPAGIFRGRLQRPVPFPVDLDLDALTP